MFSSRFSGENATHQANIEKVLTKLGDCNDRAASFCCMLAIVRRVANPVMILVTGTWKGELAMQADGTVGFDYDPIFYLKMNACTAAQFSSELKNQLSHLGQAAAILKKNY